jgi:hypothetical protein
MQLRELAQETSERSLPLRLGVGASDHRAPFQDSTRLDELPDGFV